MEYTVLVAFEVEAESVEDAQDHLMQQVGIRALRSSNPDSRIECWWIAEDERYDGSDLESAVFVPEGIGQGEARELLEFYKAANDV